MTQKEIQTAVNKEVLTMHDEMVKEMTKFDVINGYVYPFYCSGKSFGKQLRHSDAYVLETEHYYILKSFQTIVAAIEKETDTLFDFLRLVYGYTQRSACQISKFNRDYCRGMWSCEIVLTWRPV